MKNNHRFSMTCKVDSVKTFANPAETQKAIAWMAAHGINKVWLETFRNGVEVPSATLAAAKKEFEKADFETAACVTTTKLSPKQAVGWDILTCFSDEKACENLAGIITRTAELFNTIILDDFFFNGCSCNKCKTNLDDTGNPAARAEQMLQIAEKYVVAPAKKANPKVKLIIKYPCWYEGYFARGYDVIREKDLFDATWTGTETRDPESVKAGRIPQTQASFLMQWMNKTGGEKSLGAWYDPFDCKCSTFVEQARESIIGGAKESLLHCYDYLGSDIGNVTSSSDMALENAFASAEAFNAERKSLELLAGYLDSAEPFGVALPKKPNADETLEARLPGFIGLLGIPVMPAIELEENPKSVFLTHHAAAFSNTREYVAALRKQGVPFVLTKALAEEIAFSETKNATFGVLNASSDPWELLDTGRDTLDTMRNMLLEPFGITLHAQAGVALHLFKKDGKTLFVLENFNGTDAKIRLSINGKRPRPILGIPEFSCAFGPVETTLAAHSLILCEA